MNKKIKKMKKDAKRVCRNYSVAVYDLTHRCVCGHCCPETHPTSFGVFAPKTGVIYTKVPSNFWEDMKKALRIPPSGYVNASDLVDLLGLPYAGEFFYTCSDVYCWGEDEDGEDGNEEIVYIDGDIVGYGKGCVVIREG